MTYWSLTGFGDPTDLTTFSFFRVLRGDRGEYGDWDVDENGSVHQIAGSNTYDEMFMGFGPAVLSLRVVFNSTEDYQRFRKRLSSFDTRVGTLVLFAGFTSHDAIVKHELDRDYAYFPDTTMLPPTDVTHEIGGDVECTVTFRRQEVL